MGQKDEGSKFEQDAAVVNFKARHGTGTQEHIGVTCLTTLCVCVCVCVEGGAKFRVPVFLC